MRISVVIPVRDDARLLERCLAALARQSRPADEIVVVDNGSSDDSAAVAHAAGARVVVEPVPGIPRAASAGYDAATGDLIARIDADTVCPPGWVAAVEEHFATDPSLGFLTGDARFPEAAPWIDWLGRHIYIGSLYGVMTPLLGHPPLFGSNFAMRADAWRQLSAEVHRDRRDIHDDLDLALHVRPGMTVRRDRTLIVDVSARPLTRPGSLLRHMWWVVTTLTQHGWADAPWRRRARRRAAAASGAPTLEQPAG
ncbi:glycosyltransferase family A protein [Microbacterium sp. JZ31]|uniref:glycosyltransferase family A protein n=1 Tax=Microbacterium sp. JZ31 TaxID=1906274 RepID=UPI0019313E02|nr:glycosyltransferase family A protein [Microbacterium sp. JZ31]